MFLNKNFCPFFQKWRLLSSPVFPFLHSSSSSFSFSCSFFFLKRDLQEKGNEFLFILFSSFFLSERERELGRKKNEIILFISFVHFFFSETKVARKEEEGMLVFLLFLLPVFCLKRSGRGKRKEQEFSLLLSQSTLVFYFLFLCDFF